MLEQQPNGRGEHNPPEGEIPPAAWQPDNSLRWWADSLQKAFDDEQTLDDAVLADAGGCSLHTVTAPTPLDRVIVNASHSSEE